MFISHSIRRIVLLLICDYGKIFFNDFVVNVIPKLLRLNLGIIISNKFTSVPGTIKFLSDALMDELRSHWIENGKKSISIIKRFA